MQSLRNYLGASKATNSINILSILLKRNMASVVDDKNLIWIDLEVKN